MSWERDKYFFHMSPQCCRMFMRGSRKFYQRGSKFDNGFFLFFFDEWRKDQNATISGPSSARQRNAIRNGVSLACR